MDPSNTDSFDHRSATLSNGHTYHFIDQIPQSYTSETPTLLLLHGFPDFWYGWRYQIGPWASKGWRVIVPDMLGYGDTSHPEDPKQYTFRSLCNDLALLLDSLHVQTVIVVGHDWGSFTAWRFSQWQPRRVRAVITMSVPFIPKAENHVSVEVMAQKFPDLGYQLFFTRPDSAVLIGSRVDIFLDFVYRRRWSRDFTKTDGIRLFLETFPRNRPVRGDILSEKERAYYIEAFKKSGFQGPTNYYRTAEFRFDEEKVLPRTLPASLPALFFYPMADRTCAPSMVEVMKQCVPNLEIVELEGSCHWCLVDAKEVVTKKVIDWVENLLGKNAKL